ncbi:MAG: endonuclease MutS2 [Thermoflavifilum sp.]|nr:endonuclease MutS2 [Thermoflavifilum sp.]MCL6512818.1 endonuclease MutS2 [Alicyclobacillus sp.]
MNERTLSTLEFDKVRQHIAQYAATPLGRERILELEPYPSRETAVDEIAAADECLRIVWAKGAPPMEGISDIRPWLRRASVGGMLTAAELLAIARFIAGGRSMRSFLEDLLADDAYPHVRACLEDWFDAAQTEQKLRAAIADDGTLYDNASPELRRLRSERRQLESRVRQELDRILRSHQKYLQEAVIAMRGEYLCLPVRAEFRHLVPGVARDYSASGATVYIEPQAVIELHQRIQELQAAEAREVERILMALTAVVGEVATQLEANAERIARLDAWFAKAGYARAMDGSAPVLREDAVWRIIEGRHPLLPKDTVVPLSLELGMDYRVLVITGPNTGGKTVALKTVGLLTVMAMSGCLLPAREGTEIGWCDDVWVDIGDEQSIEQSLSTFSSHMRNIVRMLEHVTARSLVLLDEIGAGTDPAEGAALAMAILGHLRDVGCTVMATTHYAELKAYAFTEPQVRNASVEFDPITLRPTYRLLVGVPGRSNALAIAARLGVPEAILARAREAMQGHDIRLDEMLARVEQARREADQARAEALAARAQAEAFRREWEGRQAALENELERMRQEAAREARRTIETARAEAERVIRELRERQRQGHAKDHELVELRKALEDAMPDELSPSKRLRPLRREGDSLPLEVGSVVRVASVGQKGEVVEVTGDGREVTVQLGGLRMKVKAKDVEVVAPPQRHAAATATAVRPRVDKTARLELDVRGETLDDALVAVDKYLDDAVVSGLSRVHIIHGKGTGVLRDGIRRHLNRHPQVASWAPGGPGEGGDGVTVVDIQR